MCNNRPIAQRILFSFFLLRTIFQQTNSVFLGKMLNNEQIVLMLKEFTLVGKDAKATSKCPWKHVSFQQSKNTEGLLTLMTT